MGDTTRILHFILAFFAIGSLAACGEEPAAPSVAEFMEDPILLDATMVRCVANRDSVSYDPECVNAREAVERIAAAAEKARQAALEAESARKRDAIRRAQEAADEVRRRAAEAERLREEAQLLGLIPATPEEPAEGPGDPSSTDVGIGVAAAQVTVEDAPVPVEGAARGLGESEPGETSPAESPTRAVTTDLGEIREQLEQRQPAPPSETSNRESERTLP